ncbi:histidine kinase, partial [Sutterella parvirubra]
GPAVWLTELSTGSGGAINVAGSLRMQSYKMALAIASPYTTAEVRGVRTREAVEEFGRRLRSQGLLNGLPAGREHPVRIRYDELEKTFTNVIQPSAIGSITSEEDRRRFLDNIPTFVDRVDGFVFALEADLNARLRLLKIVLTVTLSGALGVTFLMLWIMRRRIFDPILELGRALGSVREGGFDVRVEEGERNEIGLLRRDFNFMTEELGRLYGSLEAEVAAKTADLHQRNELLGLLNRAAEALQSEGAGFEAAVRDVLREAEGFLKCTGLAVYVRPADGTELIRFAATDDWTDAEARRAEMRGASGDVMGEMRALGLPDDDGSVNALETLAGIMGRALERAVKKQDERRLAVLEERSTIARELHDSIAQSLSFSRIQLLRLQRAVDGGAARDEVSSITAELREGISSAYRQLREVLTAFRLQVNASGLAGAVDETVRAFENRTGVPVRLQNRYLGAELTANELVHLTHILREALSNVEKHARAKSVAVTVEGLEGGGFRLAVEDDGIGLPEKAEKASHFGLGIMAERAQALHGTLTCSRRPEGGTKVELIRPALY